MPAGLWHMRYCRHQCCSLLLLRASAYYDWLFSDLHIGSGNSYVPPSGIRIFKRNLAPYIRRLFFQRCRAAYLECKPPSILWIFFARSLIYRRTLSPANLLLECDRILGLYLSQRSPTSILWIFSTRSLIHRRTLRSANRLLEQQRWLELHYRATISIDFYINELDSLPLWQHQLYQY